MLLAMRLRSILSFFLVAFASTTTVSFAQSPSSATLHEIHADGAKKLTEFQLNSSVDRDALQAAADKLVHTGLFAHVKYDFHTRGDQLTVNFHVEENALLPAFFDNIPWFDDSEIR